MGVTSMDRKCIKIVLRGAKESKKRSKRGKGTGRKIVTSSCC